MAHRTLTLGGALLLSLPTAFERENCQNAAGLRTFPLVTVTSCGFLLIGYRFLDDQIANARLMQGLIGGLGFLGGGAILKYKGEVQGMATAASIWCSGAVGMSAAYGQWETGIVLSIMNFCTLRYGSKVKEKVDNIGSND